MFIDIIKEMFIMFFVIYGIISLIISIIKRSQNIQDSDSSITLLFFFGFSFLYVQNFFFDFKNILSLNKYVTIGVFVIVYIIAFVMAHNSFDKAKESLENKILRGILFTKHFINDTYRYYKLEYSGYETLSLSPEKIELFNKTIKRKYKLNDIKNKYITIDYDLNIKLYESAEEFEEYFKSIIVKNTYLLKFEDGEIAHLEEDFVKQIYQQKK